MRILITGAGGPSAISVWKSLATKHELHMADMDPCAAGLYLVPAEQRLLVPRGDDPGLVASVLSACRARKIDLLIPTVDAELAPIALAQDQFVLLGVKVALAPAAALQLCRDKHRLLETLRGTVPVPASELLTEDTSVATMEFPRFAKPRFGAGSRGLVRINSASDLGLLPRDGSYLVQEYLPGTEYSVDVYLRGDGVALAAVPRERMKVDSGIAITARTSNLRELSDLAIRAAQSAGIRYIANVQVKQSSTGEWKLLEINPRFPGTLPLTARAGIDIPALLVAEMAGESLPDTLLPFEEIAVVRYWMEQYFDPKEMDTVCLP